MSDSEVGRKSDQVRRTRTVAAELFQRRSVQFPSTKQKYDPNPISTREGNSEYAGGAQLFSKMEEEDGTIDRELMD